MKLPLILGGLFILIFICLIPLKHDLDEYEVQKNGDIITATITYIPNCLGTKIMYSMKFKYAGNEYDKKVGCGFSDSHKVGELINLKHEEGTNIFLLQNEKIEKEFISTALLGIFGIGIIVYGFKK